MHPRLPKVWLALFVSIVLVSCQAALAEAPAEEDGPAIAAGKPLPDFELGLLNGPFNGRTTVSKSDLLGRVYLIEFWGTWCGPCIAEIPKIHEVWDKYKGQGFQVLSLAVDSSPLKVLKYINDEGSMPWLHHYVEDGFQSELLETFEVSRYPRLILVGADGNIVTTEGLRDELMDTVGKALAEPTVSASSEAPASP